MKFAELVEINELRELCESFTALTGAVTAILDLEGNILVATGWQEICTRFHRVNPQSASRCTESDTVLAGQLKRGEAYNVYRCRNGLVDVAVPIIVDGEHLANLFTGQFFFHPPDEALFVAQAEEFGFDQGSYLEALRKVPVFSEPQVRKMMDFLAHLARFIGEMGLAGKRLEEASERKRIEETLRFIAQRGWIGHAEDFLTALASYLGQTLTVDYVIIDRLAADAPGFAETVALYAKGALLPSLRYPLANTPCENVMGKCLCCYPRGVQSLFPDDPLLAEMGVESYAGVPLWDSEGNALGLIAIMDGKPLGAGNALTNILQLVATSAAAALERERSDALLRRREQEFRTLAENIPDLIVRYDSQLSSTYVNPAWEQTSGLSAADIHLLPSPTLSEYQAAIRRALTTGSIEQVVFDWINSRNERHFLEYSIVPEYAPQGERSGVLAIGRDITARKQAEENIRLNLAQQKALLDVYQEMPTASLPEIIAHIVDKCVHLTGSAIGFVGLISDDGQQMEAHIWSEKAMLNCPLNKPLDFPLNAAGLWAEPVRQGRVINVNDYRAPNPLKKGYPEGHLELVRFLGVPVVDAGRVVAVAGVANRREEYAEAEQYTVSLLLEGMWEIIKRKRAEGELRALNEELEARVRRRTTELAAKNVELERINKVFVGRELRMVELKEKIRELERHAGIKGEQDARS